MNISREKSKAKLLKLITEHFDQMTSDDVDSESGNCDCACSARVNVVSNDLKLLLAQIEIISKWVQGQFGVELFDRESLLLHHSQNFSEINDIATLLTKTIVLGNENESNDQFNDSEDNHIKKRDTYTNDNNKNAKTKYLTRRNVDNNSKSTLNNRNNSASRNFSQRNKSESGIKSLSNSEAGNENQNQRKLRDRFKQNYSATQASVIVEIKEEVTSEVEIDNEDDPLDSDRGLTDVDLVTGDDFATNNKFFNQTQDSGSVSNSDVEFLPLSSDSDASSDDGSDFEQEIKQRKKNKSKTKITPRIRNKLRPRRNQDQKIDLAQRARDLGVKRSQLLQKLKEQSTPTVSNSSETNSSNPGPVQCDQCGKILSSPGTLKEHTKSHSNTRSYKCDLCDKTFVKSSNLREHYVTHLGEVAKGLECRFCSKLFLHGRDLDIHERTHTGEKPYLCHLCPKSFNIKQHLTYHIRTHTGEKPCICSQCNRAFSQPNCLRLHKKNCKGIPHVPERQKRQRRKNHDRHQVNIILSSLTSGSGSSCAEVKSGSTSTSDVVTMTKEGGNNQSQSHNQFQSTPSTSSVSAPNPGTIANPNWEPGPIRHFLTPTSPVSVPLFPLESAATNPQH